MKKYIILIFVSILLCGCSSVNEENSNAIEKSTSLTVDTTENIEVHEQLITNEVYSSVDDFSFSSFCDKMKSDGYTPYLLEYDEERYSLTNISSEKNWYTYNLYDTIEKKDISYTIMYDTYVEKIEDFGEVSGGKSEDIITKAQRNGAEYDVYLSKTPYIEATNYGLLYIPAEGCEASIYAHNSTSDEILEYFDDFELVADNG